MTLAPADLQELIGHGKEAWTQREGETWEDFVRRKAPGVPAIWHPLDRIDFGRALDAALSRGERRERVRALVLPLWWGNNEDEVERDDEWSPILAVTSDEDTLLFDTKLEEGDALWARAELTIVKGTFVTRSRGYAPGVGGVERLGTFATVETRVRAIVEEIADGGRVALTPSPARMIPPFSMHYVPGFDLATVPAEIADAAKRVAAALTFEPED
jgi:hypothetical protein